MGESVLSHKDKGSPVPWFILAVIPFVNLYFLWKVAENISGHEKVGEDYSYLDLREEAQEAELSGEPARIIHKEEGVSTEKWFALGSIFLLIFLLVLIVPFFSQYSWLSQSLSTLILVSICVGFYLAWRMADLISGHREKSESNRLVHRKEKGSTTEKFLMALFPLVNLLFLWEASRIIAKHETIAKE